MLFANDYNDTRVHIDETHNNQDIESNEQYCAFKEKYNIKLSAYHSITKEKEQKTCSK